MIAEGVEQRSLAWFRARLGCFSGSRVSELMKEGRKKGEPWSETAKAYISQVAAERMMNPTFVADDGIFADYLEWTSASSKAMRWGEEQESEARKLYMRLNPGVEVAEVSSCKHDTIVGFAASPDGMVYDRRGGGLKCLEIKCPSLGTYMKYRHDIKDNATLKSAKPEYYWQTMAEMSCTGAEATDFVAYCPWLTDPIHIVRIERDDDAIGLMEQRVRLANEAAAEMMGA